MPSNVPSEEATRQLQICNACRYCEGYCAVFPALERRISLTVADIAQLANLCHDCRACLYACPYSPPHEFAINLPKLFAAERIETYEECVSPPRLVRTGRISGPAAALATLLTFAGVIVILSAITMGFGALVDGHSTPASPYSVLPYPVLLVTVLAPSLFAVIVLARGAYRYWVLTGSVRRGAATQPDGNGRLRGVLRAIKAAAALDNLAGGGEKCHVNEDPSMARRTLHQFVSVGFVLCLCSTVSAAIMEDIMGTMPPYGVVSVPVLLGVLGGGGLVIGCSGLIVVKGRSDGSGVDRRMVLRDYGLLIALDALACTGLLTLMLRSSAAYGTVLVLHLATVGACILAAPYSKFVHWVYRGISLINDNWEIAEESPRR